MGGLTISAYFDRCSGIVKAGSMPVSSPHTAAAGFVGNTWPVINQSNSIRTAASCCLTPGCECSCDKLSEPAMLHQAKNLAARASIGAVLVRVADVGR